MAEGVDPLALGRHGAHDRNPETTREQGGINADPGAFGRIGHIERNDHGQAEVGHLRGEEKIAHQIGGINDANHGVRLGFAVEMTREEVERHAFIGRGGSQAVGAGEVDQGEGAAATDPEAGFFFDRDSRVVADFLTRAGQAIEKGCFARVRITDQREADRTGSVLAHTHAAHSIQPHNRHGRRVPFAQTQAQAAEFDFHRVTQRGHLNDRHLRARQKPHGEQALHSRVFGDSGLDDAPLAGPKGSQQTNLPAHCAAEDVRPWASCRAQTCTQPNMQRRRATQLF